jgi:hypothetical protein
LRRIIRSPAVRDRASHESAELLEQVRCAGRRASVTVDKALDMSATEPRNTAACEVLVLHETPQDPVVDALGIGRETGVRAVKAIEVDQILHGAGPLDRLLAPSPLPCLLPTGVLVALQKCWRAFVIGQAEMRLGTSNIVVPHDAAAVDDTLDVFEPHWRLVGGRGEALWLQ